MNIYLDTLGCRLNAAETESLARQFTGGGACVVSIPDNAQIIVLNTCAVTAQAARKSRHRVRILHRDYPDAAIAVVGCGATDDPDSMANLPGVQWVIDNEQKTNAVEIITNTISTPADWSPGKWGHTRAFLPVQDGCDHHCTYCITTVLRGPSRSRAVGDVLADVNHFVAHGAQEVILTGVSLGAYGKDQGIPDGLGILVKHILTDTDLPRLRLSSIEPWDVDDTLIAQCGNPCLCRQLHIPLQSGTDSVLRRMGRSLDTADFSKLVARIREVCPDIALTTDVIVGFPGEADADFQQTLAYVRSLGFAKLHVFAYSERKGTAATRLSNSVSPKIRKARATALRQVSEKLATVYRTGFVGQTLQVLFQHQRDGWWYGVSDNYLSVRVNSAQNLYNTLCNVTIVGDDGQSTLTGVVV